MKKVAGFLLVFVLLQCTLIHQSKADGFMSSSEENSDKDSEKGAEEPHQHGHDHVDHGGDKQEAKVVASSDTNSQPTDVKQMAAAGVSGYNETCAPNSGRTCNTDRGFVCRPNNNTCGCKNEFAYVPQLEQCLTADIRGIDATFSCQYDQQCQEGKRGRLSRCFNGKCECYDHQSSGRKEAVRVDGICYLKKTFGDACETHTECNATIPGQASCEVAESSVSAKRYCRCELTHIWDSRIAECVQIAIGNPLNFVCKSDYQCMFSEMKNLSRCHAEQHKCVCEDPTKPGPENAVYYEKECFQRKMINDTCTENRECHASLGTNSFCGEHEAYIEEKVCQCPKGKTCKGGAMGILAAPIATIFLVAMSLVLGRVQITQ